MTSSASLQVRCGLAAGSWKRRIEEVVGFYAPTIDRLKRINVISGPDNHGDYIVDDKQVELLDKTVRSFARCWLECILVWEGGFYRCASLVDESAENAQAALDRMKALFPSLLAFEKRVCKDKTLQSFNQRRFVPFFPTLKQTLF